MSSTKTDAVLIEIREEDGAQCYRFGSGLNDLIWLCGWHRAQNVKLGDRGDLVYSVENRGRWTLGHWTFLAYDKSAPAIVDDEGRICVDLEASDEELHRHKREAFRRYEQWFHNLCQKIWDEFFAGMFTAREIKAETIYVDEKFTCPHCGESWALFPRKDGKCACHRCLTVFVMERGADDGGDGHK